VARAVDHIHSKKVIHRDIKPENIHIDAVGKVKMMDFGIAKSDGMELTRAGFTLGTPYYMAPEQVLGKMLSPQTDVYSFGVMLYELLTGQRAISGDQVEAIFDQILHRPLDLSALDRLNIPTDVTGLIRHCTTKPPAQRPNGLGDVADRIEQILIVAHGSKPLKLPIPKIHSAEEPSRLEKLVERLPPELRAPRVLMGLTAVAMFVLVLLLYLVLLLARVV